ncbi:MAG TPA: 3'-5' exonuclease, partial [Burkholderiaceae bacterium]|nr:3'-5' exonuclease [Burkholderiaceae bacterium]
SSGLNVTSDRLLAIAAIAVHTDGKNLRIALGDSFEVVLRNDVRVADKSNILLHGIGVGAQRHGVEPSAALLDFERYIGKSPLIAFHAAFDQAMILRGFDAAVGRRPPNVWMDLEPLAAVLHPKVKARSLDEWMAQMNITCAVRHQAAADTLATAELLLKLWPAALRELRGDAGFAAVKRLADQRKWLAS